MSETVTVYVPGSSDGTLNVPVPSVMALYFVAVALFATTTLAPGMTPPAASTTVPASVEVVCAQPDAVDSRMRKAAVTRRLASTRIKDSCVMRIRRNLRGREGAVNHETAVLMKHSGPRTAFWT